MNGKESQQPTTKAMVDSAANCKSSGNSTTTAKLDGHSCTDSAPFDLQASLTRLGGSHDLFQSLVQFFLEDCPGLLQQLRAALDRDDAMQVERAGHSIKGLAANFG